MGRYYLKLIASAAAMSGWQWVNSIMYAIGGPLLQSKLHMTASQISLVFAVVGPLCSVFTQPLVGAYSDRTGRRRVFLVVGACGTSVGAGLVALSDVWTRGALVSVLAGLVLINVFASVLQPVARAAVLDGLLPSQHPLANAYVNVSMMVSAVVAPAVGVALFQTGQVYRWLFVSASLWILITAAISTVASADQPRASSAASSSSSSNRTCSVFRSMFSVLSKTRGRDTWPILLAYFFTWCAFSPFLVLDNIWFPENVYHGLANGTAVEQHAYQQGVRMGLINSSTFSAVSLLYSLLLPRLIATLGPRVPWIASSLLSAVCYALFMVDGVATVAGGLLINAGIAVNFCTSNVVPFSLLSRDTATLMGLMNASTQVALLILNPLAGLLLSNVSANVALPIAAFGASFALIALPFIALLKKPLPYEELA